MSESLLQTAFINWVRAALPQVTVWHVYNENAINAIQGKIKKDRGVLAGVHDNHLIWADRNYATIELKDPGKPSSANKYSDAQKSFAERMDAAGFPHACCQNAEQIEAAIASFGLVPRFRFPASIKGSAKKILFQEMLEIYKMD